MDAICALAELPGVSWIDEIRSPRNAQDDNNERGQTGPDFLTVIQTLPPGSPPGTTQMQPTSNHMLPSFAELQQPAELAFKSDPFLELVNRPCPTEWVKGHPTLKVKDSRGQFHPLWYLPIDKVRFLLTAIFGPFVREEIISVQQHFNSEVVTVRLHYCIPGTSTWLYQDGVGAVAVQTDKGESAANLAAIKSDGVMKAAPAAASFAVSNAAAKIGKVFGGDLNKDDALDFTGTYASQDTQPVITGPVNPVVGMTPAQAKHAAMRSVGVVPGQTRPQTQEQPTRQQAAQQPTNPAQSAANPNLPPSFLNLSNAVL